MRSTSLPWVRIDLHTHSSVSDGTDAPGDVVRAAHAAGLDVVGLTDHDTAGGWPEAVAVALDLGIGLVRGVEISTKHGGRSVHLLAYLPDPGHPGLAEALDSILDGRNARVPGICSRLRDLGIDITAEDVHRAAGPTAAAGRPHVADALVAMGACASRSEAFSRWLNPGRPAYVTRHAVPLEEMLGLVADAGGASVLAHPWGRGGAEVIDLAGFAALRDLGLGGIEVDHEDHDPAARARLRGIADELGLVVTGSSDYHGTGKTDHGLGCNLTEPEEYERLLEVAARSARAAGREVPAVIG